MGYIVVCTVIQRNKGRMAKNMEATIGDFRVLKNRDLQGLPLSSLCFETFKCPGAGNAAKAASRASAVRL